MRQFLGTMLILFAFSAKSQFSIQGRIVNGANQNAVSGATVKLLDNDGTEAGATTTDLAGNFKIVHLKQQAYRLNVSHVNYKPYVSVVNIIQQQTALNILLEEAQFFLEPLEIKATRAGERSPFAKQNISKADIEKINLGQDIPFLLNQTPSVVINSDAGNGIGYTGIRIRGSDASRINVTLNGIPYNDAESQGTFFVDLPDFASSINSIQVQRGVGTSSNGAGAFGATINLSTNEFNEKSYAALNNSYGSFNTWKHTLKLGSGLIGNHFTIDARLSKVSSDGYIDRATSDLKSFYLSGAYISKQSTLRLNIFSGTERTYQSWYGVDSATLHNNRTYNAAGTEKPGTPYDNQTDNYQQDHYQLFFNHKINNRWSFNTALFLVKGDGYYEQYRSDNAFGDYDLPDVIVGSTTITESDLVRQLWLDNSFYGQIASLHFQKPGTSLTFGGGWNTYDGTHFGKVTWAETGFPKDYEWYRLPALKKDANVYAKWQQKISDRFELFADLQYRTVEYKTGGFRDNPHVNINRSFHFINPKAGISYTNNGLTVFASYALGQKEPNRDDFEAGVTSQPDREQLHDIEFGVEKRTSSFQMSANVYYMIYKDQLVLTGKINDVGAYTRVNVPNSSRIGIELLAGKKINRWLNVSGNLAISENKIRKFTEYMDDYDNGGQVTVEHQNKAIAFSPAVIGGLNIEIAPVKHISLALSGKYVSRQYLDNTENRNRSLDPFFVQDARLNITIPNKLFSHLDVVLQANNIFNEMYEPNGYTFSYYYLNKLNTENFYFPMAGSNFMVGVNIKL